jgi:2-C-methyl-D-erythritol 4-phosphate cytidylyltransferase
MSLKKLRISVIIPAAGNSKRISFVSACNNRIKGYSKRKPFLLIGDRPILAHTLDIFKEIKGITEIILVVNKKDLSLAKRYFKKSCDKIIEGGRTRAGSVYNAVKILDRDSDIVLIHDGVRPFVTKEIVLNSIRAAVRFGAAVVAVPVIPTIKRADEDDFVFSTLDRKMLWEIQTPQAFKKDIIIEAYRKYRGNPCGHSKKAGASPAPTDDAMLVEKMGHKVKLLMGSYENIKITTPKDLIVAKALIKK